MAGDETESAVISGRFYSGYEPSIVGQIGFIHGAEIALDATAAANAELNVMLGGDAAAWEEFTSLGERRSHRVEGAQPPVSPRLVHRVDDRAVQRPKQELIADKLVPGRWDAKTFVCRDKVVVCLAHQGEELGIQEV